MINIEDQKGDYYYENGRPELIPLIPPTAKKILDVGCGRGTLAKVLKDRNKAEVWGIEYDKPSAKEAEKLLDRVLSGDILQLIPGLPQDFDVICFNDVLEHLIDPYQTLEKIKPTLSDRGVVFASIPQIRYFKAIIEVIKDKDLQYTDHGTFDRTHLRFFTKSLL